MSTGKWNKYRMTVKQRQIMRVICEGNRDDNGAIVSWCDIDQILERIPYVTSKDSMHFSIRYLVQKGLCEKGAREIRRTKRRAVIVPTNLGYSMMNKPKPAASQITDDVVDEF